MARWCSGYGVGLNVIEWWSPVRLPLVPLPGSLGQLSLSSRVTEKFRRSRRNRIWAIVSASRIFRIRFSCVSPYLTYFSGGSTIDNDGHKAWRPTWWNLSHDVKYELITSGVSFFLRLHCCGRHGIPYRPILRISSPEVSTKTPTTFLLPHSDVCVAPSAGFSAKRRTATFNKHQPVEKQSIMLNLSPTDRDLLWVRQSLTEASTYTRDEI